MPAPYLSDPTTDPDGFGQPDLVAQQDALLRRKALLVEQARQAAAQLGIYAPPNTDSMNQEVGGFTLSTGQRIPGRVVSNWGTALKAAAPLVAQSRLQNDQSALDSDQGVFNQAARADAMRRLNAMPQATPAIPGHPEYTTGSDTPSAMTSGAPATEPSLKDTLRFAFGLRDNPLTSDLGTAYAADALVKAPERKEAREFRASESAANRLERIERADADRASREFTAQLVAGGKSVGTWHEMGPASDGSGNSVWYNPATQERRLGPAGKPPTSGQGTFHETATPDPDKPGNVIWQNPATGDQVSRLPSKAEKGPKELPAHWQAKWGDNANALAQVNNALTALDQASDSVGWKGYLSKLPAGDKVLNYFNPDGTVTRALVADIGSLKLHDRSGASVTASETPRLIPFIPQITDSAKVAADKLRNFKTQYEQAQQGILDLADDMGWKAPTVRNRASPTQAPPPLQPSKTGANPPVDVKPQMLAVAQQDYNRAAAAARAQPGNAKLQQARDLAWSDLEAVKTGSRDAPPEPDAPRYRILNVR